MNLKNKAAAVLLFVLTAIIMGGCGTAIEDDRLPSLPSVDAIRGESASVAAHDAEASPNSDSDPAEGGYSDEYESVLTAPLPENEIEEDNEETVSEPAEETVCIEEEPLSEIQTDYDEEFFSDDLFIGDSITTGLSGYGFIDEKNVFAKIGLNPLTALDTEIPVDGEGTLFSDELSAVLPRHAYIMLGSNGIEWITVNNMADAISGVIDAAREASPDTKIVMLSVPPVTKEYDDSNPDIDVMDRITEYNTLLSELCAEKEVGFVDITSVLEDNSGYFIPYLAENDGIHFKPTAYKMVLSRIQSALS